MDDLAKKKFNSEVTPDALKEAGLIRSTNKPVKILGRGDVTAALQVRVHAISASASEKISQAGGKVEIISGTLQEST